MTDFWAPLLAYLLGSVPAAWLLAKWREGGPALRGLRFGLVAVAIGVVKGALAVRLADGITDGSPAWMSAAAVAVMLGNTYSIFQNFEGGKAVAAFLGAFALIYPVPLAATAVVFAAAVMASRHLSAGAIVAAASFPLAVWLIQQPPLALLPAPVAAAALILWRHRENVARLRAGIEPVVSLRSPLWLDET